uniref:Uncharacterized protein n=1 Tax=Anser brachyrhynchus TaxID=132585 RepID=A0A8B9BU13_9AVES
KKNVEKECSHFEWITWPCIEIINSWRPLRVEEDLAFPAIAWTGNGQKPRIIFVALCWTLPRSSLSFLNWGPQNWTQYSR